MTSNPTYTEKTLTMLLEALYQTTYNYKVEHVTVVDKDYIYLYQEDKLAFIVRVMLRDGLITKTEVIEELNKFRAIGIVERCMNFRIVAPNGFNEAAYNYEQYNLILSGEEYIEHLRKGDLPFELFPHNYIAYKKIVKAFKLSNRVAAVQPTGTGKSVLISRLIYDNPDKRIVILSPNDFVFKQIKKFLHTEVNVKFITYAKTLRMSTANFIKLNADWIFVDEFHRIGAELWGVKTLELIACNPNAKLFGTTATPDREDGKNMADEMFENELAVNITLNEAIRHFIVPAPYYVAAIYNLDEQAQLLKERIQKSSHKNKANLAEKLIIAANNWTKSHGVPDILRKHVPGESKKLIIFCKNIEHLEEMTDTVTGWFKDAGFNSIIAYKIHSLLNDNRAIYERFEKVEKTTEHLHLLFVVDKLNEGVHIKGIDGVVFLRRTESSRIYYQQMGRGITVDFNKKPLIIDLVNNFKNTRWKFEGNGNNGGNSDGIDFIDIGLQIFDEVKDIQDLFESFTNEIESWDVFIEELTAYKKKHGNCDVPRKYKNEWLGNKVHHIRTRKKNDILSEKQIAQLIELGFKWRIKEVPEDSWNKYITKLGEYKEEHGDCNVIRNYNDQWLATKVNYCRQRYSKGVLEADKIIQLEEMGFVWNPKEISLVKSWNRLIEGVKAYKAINGHCNIPTGDNKINNWLSNKVSNVRVNYKKGILSKEQIAELEALGFVWKFMESTRVKDRDFIESLKAYKAEFGNCDVSVRYKDKWLGGKVTTMRQNYRKKKLTSEQISELELLGFRWVIVENSDKIFDKLITELIAYKKEYGNCDVSKNYKNKKLGTKVVHIRKLYKKEKLSAEQIKRLEVLGFKWSMLDEAWNIFISKLSEYKEEHGDCNVIRNYNDQWLANKINTTRAAYKEGKLTDDKIAQLDSMGFQWKIVNSPDESWNLLFEKLEVYKNEFGNCDVPYNYEDKWFATKVKTLRVKYEKGELSKEGIEKLESFGFRWRLRDTYEDVWKKSIAKMEKFYEKYGHCNVPVNYEDSQLYSITNNWRDNYKKGKLAKEKVEALNKLGFVWKAANTPEESWNMFIPKLEAYKEMYGNCDVPRSYEDVWLMNKVRTTREHKERLSPEKITQLDSMGFRWKIVNVTLCVNCGKELLVKQHNAIYCSVTCKNQVIYKKKNENK